MPFTTSKFTYRLSKALLLSIVILCLVNQASAVRLIRQKDDAVFELSNAPYKRPPPPSQPSNMTSGLSARSIPGLDSHDLEKRQYCSDPNYPYQNSCTGSTCCPSYAASCCPNSGNCLDSSTYGCCNSGQQCALSGSCCDRGCCSTGRECCGSGTIDAGCCYVGENCYQYDNGPYTGRYTCLSPAEAASIFDTIRYTTTNYVGTYASNAPGSTAAAVTTASRVVATSEEVTVGLGGGAATSATPVEISSQSSEVAASTASDEPLPSFSSPATSAGVTGPVAGDPECPGGFFAVSTGGFTCIGGSSTATAAVGTSGPTAVAGGAAGGSGSANAAVRTASGMMGLTPLVIILAISVAAFML